MVMQEVKKGNKVPRNGYFLGIREYKVFKEKEELINAAIKHMEEMGLI